MKSPNCNRFVNGAVDPLQSRQQYAIAVSSIAKDLGIPEFLVEIRHQATHNRLPTLSVLRLGTAKVCHNKASPVTVV